MRSISLDAPYVKSDYSERVGPFSVPVRRGVHLRLLDEVAKTLAVHRGLAIDFARPDNAGGADSDRHCVGSTDRGRDRIAWNARVVLRGGWRGRWRGRGRRRGLVVICDLYFYSFIVIRGFFLFVL